MAQKTSVPREAVKHAIMWFVLVFAFFPLYLMFVVSFKTNNQFTRNPWFFDSLGTWQWTNWLQAWKTVSNYISNSIVTSVAAVVIGTRPERALDTMRECAELGIKHVWMHRGPGAGSVSALATQYGRERGITVIDGGCPCMFGPTADFGHKVMRVLYSGHVPKQV